MFDKFLISIYISVVLQKTVFVDLHLFPSECRINYCEIFLKHNKIFFQIVKICAINFIIIIQTVILLVVSVVENFVLTKFYLVFQTWRLYKKAQKIRYIVS